MPVEAEHGGDEADGESFEEESGEHEDHGGQEWQRRPELGRPVPVKWDSDDGDDGESRPEQWLQPRVPRR